MTSIDFKSLTPEQQAEIAEQVHAEDAAAKKKHEQDVAAYKTLVSDTVTNVFPALRTVSETLVHTKQSIRETFASVLDMKADLYGVKDGQQSHTFTSKDGKYRVKIGFNVLDNYDDTAETGEAMVKEYLNSLGDSDKAQQAVRICLSLLAKNKEGSLKASKIMTLRKHATESGNPQFIKGVDIIMDAYNPIESKTFIRAEYKDENGAWVQVPLGITEA